MCHIFGSLFLLFASLSLVFPDDGTILVITSTNDDEQCTSSYSLTSYTETAGGLPADISRCSKYSTFDDITTLNEDEDCVDELEDIIDFCQAAFVENNKTTHCLSTLNVSLPESNVSSVYSRVNACESINTIRTEYLNFERILDRTLVGVYARTCENKTICLNAYTRWLCSVQLYWFTPSDEFNVNCTKCLNETVQVENTTYTRMLPCVGICHEVLRRCPYYLPSEQQDNEDSKVLIYGGYPAFDCPQQINGISYSNSDSCFGNSAIRSTTVNSFIILFLLAITVLCIIVFR